MIRWIALGICFYLGLLVCKLPAQFGLWLAASEIPKEVQINGVSGSIWSGKIASVSWQGQTIDELYWQLNPMALLTAKVEVDLQAGQSRSPLKLDGRVTLSGSGVSIHDTQFAFPAALIGQFYPLPATLKGVIKGSIAEASQGSPWCDTLQGKVEWLDPSVYHKMLGQELVLDDTTAKLSCDKGNLVADISDKGNVLGLSTNAQLTQKKYFVKGELKPGAGFPEQFKQGLMFIASPISDGRYEIELNGSL